MQFSEVKCLIAIVSENPESYMFHTPNIQHVGLQAEAIGIPIIIQKTKGEKEKELDDLKDAIKKAIQDYNIEAVVTGAVESIYQASRVQAIYFTLIFYLKEFLLKSYDLSPLLSSGLL